MNSVERKKKTMTKEEKILEKQQKEALKKQIAEEKAKEKELKAQKVEFPKFLKSFCSQQYDFLFSDQFALYVREDNADKVFICFPKQKYTYLFGMIDLSDSPLFNNWVRLKHGTIKFNSEVLKEIKGRNLSDFLGVESTDNTFTIKTTDKDYVFERLEIDVEFPSIQEEIDYSYQIKKELLENNKFKLYYNSENKPSSVPSDKILIEAPTKMFKFIQKDTEHNELKYSVRVSKEAPDKTRMIQFASKGKKIQLFQQFRIV